MSETVDTIEYKGYTINIKPDDMAENPREWDNLGKMVCFHKRYDLGDVRCYRSEEFDGWKELADWLIEEEEAGVILPLYLYDHSGITMSTGAFSCPWDSGQVGFIYVSKKKMLEEYSKKRISKGLINKVTKLLEGEVEVYDHYLTGSVYYYTIKDKNDEDVDGCGGFYGHKWKENGLEEYAFNAIDCHVENERRKKQERAKVLIRNRVPLERRWA